MRRSRTWVRRRISFVLAFALLAGLALPSPARAAPVALKQIIRATDWTSAGLGGLGTVGGTIILSGVGGPVAKAFLYWHGIDVTSQYDKATITFNGTPVTGTPLGDGTTNCWYSGGFGRAYRADVTALVPGNGSYTMSDVAGLFENVNGASLLVFFEDGNPANDRDVALFEGNDNSVAESFPGETDGWQVALSGIQYPGGAAALQLHVADGQTFADSSIVLSTGGASTTIPDSTTLWDGNSTASAGHSRAPNGSLWDVHTFDVTTLFGPNGVYALGIDGQLPNGDCLGLVVAAFDLPAGAIPAVNRPPAAMDDVATTGEDTPVTIEVGANDGDPDAGDATVITGASDPPHGTAHVNADATITYTPEPNFFGRESFTYTIADAAGETDSATVVVSVGSVNDPPEAMDDAAATDHDAPVTIPVLANDNDPEGDPLFISRVSDPANGTVTINRPDPGPGPGPDSVEADSFETNDAAAEETVTYTPNPGFAGTDSFTYTVVDGRGGSDTAQVAIEVRPAVSQDCNVTGGGQIAPGNLFGFNAKTSGPGGPSGEITYQDKPGGRRFKSTVVDRLECTGSLARITGTGVDGGVSTTFVMQVEDHGEPGSGDTFAISWPGYSASGSLTKGNIQIHD